MNNTSPSLSSIVAATFACNDDIAIIVAAKARCHDYLARATIVESGNPIDDIYIIVSGHARMLAFSIDGRLVVIEDFHSGGIFGEGCLFVQTATIDEVAAVDRVRAGTFHNVVFLGLMESYSAIALAISRLLIARLGATTRRLVEGSTLTAFGRIHAELLRQARAGQEMTIRPAPVLATFALTVQSTRESVSRAINALQKRGVIRRDADGLTVVAPHRLEELIY